MTENQNLHAENPDRSNGQDLADALEVWPSESSAPEVEELFVLRVDKNETLFIPFTTSMLRVDLHYLDFKDFRGYARCNGLECLLCRIGRQKDQRDLFPIYLVADSQIGILAVSPTQRGHALRPQFNRVLERLAAPGEGPLLVGIRKENYKFILDVSELANDADDGAEVISEFLESLRAGEVDLSTGFNKLSNEDWADFEEVQKVVKAKGITF